MDDAINAFHIGIGAGREDSWALFFSMSDNLIRSVMSKTLQSLAICFISFNELCVCVYDGIWFYA
jgi:hypothetical protein